MFDYLILGFFLLGALLVTAFYRNTGEKPLASYLIFLTVFGTVATIISALGIVIYQLVDGSNPLYQPSIKLYVLASLTLLLSLLVSIWIIKLPPVRSPELD
jgi:hypothetical protein